MPTLPSYVRLLAAGYSEAPDPAVLRTEMESGPPKQARVRSRSMVKRNVSLLIASKANYLLFVTWVKDTLEGGALWFDYTDPVSGSTKSARLVNGQYEATPGGAMAHWMIRATFETWD